MLLSLSFVFVFVLTLSIVCRDVIHDCPRVDSGRTEGEKKVGMPANNKWALCSDFHRTMGWHREGFRENSMGLAWAKLWLCRCYQICIIQSVKSGPWTVQAPLYLSDFLSSKVPHNFKNPLRILETKSWTVTKSNVVALYQIVHEKTSNTTICIEHLK